MRRILRILLPLLIVALVIVVALSKCNPNTPIVSSTDVNGSTGGAKNSSSETQSEPRSTAEAVTIEFKPTVTGIYVARDGSIRSAEITDFSNDDFDQDRYDVVTLRSYISEWVDSYNTAKGKSSVRIETIDVTDNQYDNCNYYPYDDSSVYSSPVYDWMLAHCAEYGYILRYPEGKENWYGVGCNHFHFRYVGVEVATYIMEHDLCLEEFLYLEDPHSLYVPGLNSYASF